MYGGSGSRPAFPSAWESGSPAAVAKRTRYSPPPSGSSTVADSPPSNSSAAPAFRPLLAWPRQTHSSASAGASSAAAVGWDAAGWTTSSSTAPAGGGLPAQQPRRDDARVVDDEQIPRAQQLRQLAEAVVAHAARGAAERHQPRRIALGERGLGDLRGGKLEVEVGQFHRGGSGL